MKKYLKYIIIFLLIILLCIVIIITLNNLLKLNGDSNITISYGKKYEELGATYKIFNKDFSNKIKIENNIKDKIGTYKVSYNIKILFFHIKKDRIVNIIDDEKPIITLNGNNIVNICPNTEYTEEGYIAYDNYDKDITSKVNVIKDNNIIKYSVVDSSNNLTEITREIIEKDDISPEITLNGKDIVYLKRGSKYIEQGITIKDNCDTNLDYTTESNLNISKTGTYEIKYIVKDSSSNVSSITRKIIVYSDETGNGVIYLTFDDGPSISGSTKKILDTLKAEDVKATFFVTGYPNYELLKREYDEGHTIALHTTSHNYSKIYSSVENYFNDLYAIQNYVEKSIGVKSYIMRFPGGSNNTVSNSYNYGIMNTLTNMVVNKGFTYFDWNVSASDAGGCTTSSCVYNSIINGLSKSRVNVVLIHDTKMYSADALSDVIKYAKENNYVFKKIENSTSPVRFK